MEGQTRESVEARVQCLRNIQTLLDAAVLQMQQYSTLVQSLGSVQPCTAAKIYNHMPLAQCNSNIGSGTCAKCITSLFSFVYSAQNVARSRPADTTVTSSTRTQPSPTESQQYMGAKPKTPKTSQSDSSSVTTASTSVTTSSSNSTESLKQCKQFVCLLIQSMVIAVVCLCENLVVCIAASLVPPPLS